MSTLSTNILSISRGDNGTGYEEIVSILSQFQDQKFLGEFYSVNRAEEWIGQEHPNEEEAASLRRFIEQNPVDKLADTQRPSCNLIDRFLQFVCNAVKSPRSIELGTKIASGGFGVIYRGTCQVHNDTPDVALKRAKENDSSFEKELEIFKQLNCLFVVRFFGTVTHQSVEYIVMEYCDGNLERYVYEAKKSNSALDTRAILGQAVKGLGYLHSKGIVHKDIKPENILYKETGCGVIHVKLSDFGNSRQLNFTCDLLETVSGALTGESDQCDELKTFKTTDARGTRGYICPQLLASGKPCFESDVWAMGAVVFFVVSKGEHPYQFQQLNMATVDYVVGRMKNPPNLDQLGNDWAAADLVCRLLQHEKERRPSIFIVLFHPFFSTASESAKIHMAVNVNDCFMRFKGGRQAKHFQEALSKSRLDRWLETLPSSLKAQEDPDKLANLLKRFANLKVNFDVPEKIKEKLERDLMMSHLIDELEEPLITEIEHLLKEGTNIFFLYLWHVLNTLPVTKEESSSENSLIASTADSIAAKESELIFAMFHCPLEFYKYLCKQVRWTSIAANEQLRLAATLPTSDVLQFLVSSDLPPVQDAINYLRELTMGTTALHVAANCSPIAENVRILVEKMGNVNLMTEKQWTALHHAANHNTNVEVIKVLLDAQADIDARNDKGWTPLHGAARYNSNVQVVEELINRGVDIHAITSNKQETILHLAAHNVRNEEMVSYLVAKGLQVNAPAKNRWTPLHYATQTNTNKAVAVTLIAAGADVDARSSTDCTPLHHAAYSNPNPQIAAYLIEKGADVNAVDYLGCTPLHHAVQYNPNPEVAQLLISKEANIHATNSKQWTPVHHAARYNPQLMADLLCKGADTNAKTILGWSALHLCVQRVNELKEADAEADTSLELGCIDLLIEKGSQVNAADDDGFSVLHVAIINSIETVKLLVSKGAAVNAVSKSGTTPLHHAVKYQNEEIFEYLLANGAHVDVADNEKLTPLHHAVRTGRDSKMIDLLVTAGADVHAVDERGWTLVHHAVRFNRRAGMIGILMKYKLNINAAAADGFTPLLHAIFSDEHLSERVYELVKAGAQVSGTFGGRWTALHFAADRNLNAEVINILLDNGADANATTETGDTALHLAAARNPNSSVVRNLLRHGADPAARNVQGETPIDCAQKNPKKELILAAFEEEKERDEELEEFFGPFT